MHGRGLLVSATKQYTGEFFNGKKCGKGVLIADGNETHACFVDDRPLYGMVKFASGAVFRGEFLSKEREGQFGKLVQKKGNYTLTHKGKFKNYRMWWNGSCKLKYNGDTIYRFDGNFYDGLPGNGRVTTGSDVYCGAFRDGARWGDGTLEDARGMREVRYRSGTDGSTIAEDEFGVLVVQQPVGAIGSLDFVRDDDTEAVPRKDKKRKRAALWTWRMKGKK
jgi:hypothetical protein